ncbi:single-stranded DNA-binding protein [Anaerosolibacter sp.]|uniref:single-stranded DNA-binding protein n=1 Tax=Anaerosolibacter sp. TaxID=1872527 RepID=UPI0039F0E85A
MNNVVMIGRLTRDPELRFTQGTGKAVCSFNLAVNRPFAKESDEVKADFFRVVVWGKIGENCAKYLAKGRLVGIEGRIQNNIYEKDGEKKYSTDIIAERVEFLEWGEKKNQSEGGVDGFVPVEDDDEIPF